jgi:hypothetical protein
MQKKQPNGLLKLDLLESLKEIKAQCFYES